MRRVFAGKYRCAFSLAFVFGVAISFVGCAGSPSTSPQSFSSQLQVNSITPAATTTGSGDTAITVSGSGFTPPTVVSANGQALATTFASSSQLTAVIPAAMLSSRGMLQISVSTPPSGGRGGSAIFTVVDEGTVSATQHPLVAQYTLAPPRDADVTVQFGLDTSYKQSTSAQSTSVRRRVATILLAGMKGSTTYHLRAVAKFSDGSEYVGPDQTFTTGDISSLKFPTMTVSVSGVGQPASGVEFINTVILGPKDTTIPTVVTDLEGNVIWYYVLPPRYFATPFKLLPNGHILLVQGVVPGDTSPTSLLEIDLAGNMIRNLGAVTLDAEVTSKFSISGVGGFHHDIAILPNGHLIALLQRQVTVTRPSGPVPIVDDVLVDLDRNWQPVWLWDAADHLDVNRIVLDPIDWTHGNAVVYTPDDGNLLFSMRNQSWVVKIDYENGNGTGAVLWRAGFQGDFALAGNNPADWFYGQHYPVIIGEPSAGVFSLGVYDDGNFRVLDSSGTQCGQPATPTCYTRAVIYSVNEAGKTASVTWEDNVSPTFTPALGSIQVLPNDDVEFDLGVIFFYPPTAQVLEVTQTSSPQLVWQLNADHLLYRALRMPSLYPGVQW